MSPNEKRSFNKLWLIPIIGSLLAVVGASAFFIVNRQRNQQIEDTLVPVPIGEIEGAGIETAVSPANTTTSIGNNSSAPARLLMRLSQGQDVPDAIVPLTVVGGDPLTEEEILAILARLPELPSEEDDEQDYLLAGDPIPPPRPGQTIEQPFPVPQPDVGPAEVPTGPLEVVRFSPEGPIDLAPFLSVTFNQPMVPLATLEALAAEDVPVQLTPEIPGVWKWVGTKTLTFEFAGDDIDRFPMATEYRVEIPAGTTSANGNELAETVSWTFQTPPVTLTDFYPYNEPQPLEPLIFVSFDQLIDPQAILDVLQLSADGNNFPVRLATDEEIEADEWVQRLVTNGQDGRFLVVRPQNPLPAETQFTVTLPAGTPSAEGNRVTESEQSFKFFTYSPLRINDHRCGWGNDCPPLAPFYIIFNNPIDTAVYDESMIQISPELPGAKVNIYGYEIEIQGLSAGRTEYTVRVSGELQDIFGQTLGDDETLTFRVGSAKPTLSGPNDALMTLDPSATDPVLAVYTINYDELQVRAYAVAPTDWRTYINFMQNYRYDQPSTPPGEEVLNEIIATNGEADVLTEVPIDLSAALDGETGHLIVIVEPKNRPRNEYYPMVRTWVQATQIGVDAFTDHSEMIAWATNLQDGSPLADATITLHPNNTSASTAADGLARLDIDSGATLLTAQVGDDVAILPSSSYYWDEFGWQSRTIQDELRWYVFDDRAMYRPGEEVHFKGWVRRIGGLQDGDVSLPNNAAQTLNYRIMGPQGNELDSGSLEVTELGGFDLAYTLPEAVNLGYASIIFSARGNNSGLDGQDYYHEFQIQEFRRPEFEVTARNETTGPYFVGDTAVLATSATYFAGGGLPNAEVTWNVSTTPSSYTPPNWSEFTFGEWTPWWFFPVYDMEYGYEEEVDFFGPFDGGGEGTTYETFTGLTDGAGTHYLQLDFEEITAPQPFSVMADATVMDVNRQAWSASTSLLVHPADLYVGLRSERTFVKQGEPLVIEAIVTDVDGNAVAGAPVQIEAGRLDWVYENGRWSEQLAETQLCEISSTAEPFTCEFETTLGGEYQITAVVTDGQGRQNQSRFTRWVSGGQSKPSRDVEHETAELIPDREEYQPGDTAEILVLSPFGPAEGLLTVSRSGFLYTEPFQITENSITLQIPIEDKHIPNLHVKVDLVGSAPRLDDEGNPRPELPARPAYASGQLQLAIPPHSRTLSLNVAPQAKALEPGAETMVDVTVVDANGQPVSGAELAVVVVDEAILALTNYQITDLLAVFYNDRPSHLQSVYGRNYIILSNPEQLAGQIEGELANAATDAVEFASEEIVEEEMAMDDAGLMAAPAPTMAAMDGEMARGGENTANTPIQVRSDFNPLATFAPTVITDENGRAQVPVKLPDNLTRYRIMALAVAGEKQFGSSEENLTARLPLMVRPSAPRFLNYGDVFELPIVLQNQTDEPMVVDVAVETVNLTITGSSGARVTVPANDRVEVRFPAEAASAGTARIRIAAVSGTHADAATVELPVYTPATTEAFATYGVVDDGAIAQPLLTPENVIPQYGGLEINTSSTALQALTDAVIYIHDYPYRSTEASASRILSIASLQDVLSAFEAEGLPSESEIIAAVQDDIERLEGLQNYDGGFPYWDRGKDSIPYLTIYTAHALQQAQNKGFDVPQHLLDNVSFYLIDIESHYPYWYSEYTKDNLSAYALYVRHLMGDNDVSKARTLYQKTGNDGLSMEGLAWLWQVLTTDPSAAEPAEIYRYFRNHAVETANAANFTTSYGDDAYLLMHSNRRTDGVILDALITLQPESDLIPKVVNGLLAHRTNGRWNNTQENTFILVALDRYFNTFEAETPEFVARIWLGDMFVGEHEFNGRSTDRLQTIIPMSNLVAAEIGETQNIILDKDGVGRLYYRLGLRYAPTDLNLEPLDMGFVVQRSYEAVDDPEDVWQDADGVWHIKAGARVRVTLKMVADNRRYHVALVDPLPAGLEIVNPNTAVSGSIPTDPNETRPYYWWWGNWYDHQNMRDERAEAFTPLLWDGIYNYSYVARATTPGTFVAPPAKAEEMYSPEVFGRSGTDWVIVED